MFITPEGKEIFVVDGHTHFWDGSPDNQRNVHGKQFIDCFYAYHTSLSPPEQLWEKAKFEKYSADDLYRDLFVDGPDDMAIVQSTYLRDFYKKGFNTIERNHSVAEKYPERFIVNGAFDPRDGEKALEYIHFMKETYDIQGVKLYTAEWNGDSKGWKLNDPAAYKCFELCDKLGIRNIHVHKGPTIIPLNKDAFDVHDVDYAALATLQIIHTSHNFGIWSYPAKHLRIRRSPCLKREHRDRNALRIPFLCRFARRCFSPLRNLSRLPSTWR